MDEENSLNLLPTILPNDWPVSRVCKSQVDPLSSPHIVIVLIHFHISSYVQTISHSIAEMASLYFSKITY